MHLKPSENQYLFGMDFFFNEIVGFYNQKKMPNKILLSGKKGLGKSTLAYHIINYILSQNEEYKYDVNQFNINNYKGHIDVLIQNMNNIYLFCKGSNILYLNVMQPHVIFKNIKHENEKQFKAFDFRAKIIRELYDLTREKILLKHIYGL